ncbi:hypothetical protein CASFOL_017692 [Castilleja foliolosa]|uniref:Uncharacterized protein n=1 Tax=Castilleja foliolosa TaxID=1961234 RepID=A0ABD3DBH8_9LAMI
MVLLLVIFPERKFGDCAVIFICNHFPYIIHLKREGGEGPGMVGELSLVMRCCRVPGW